MIPSLRALPRPAALFEASGREGAAAYRVALLAAVLLGVAVRAYHVLRNPFPLNDGGLFYTMVRDLQANSYRLPEATSYNGAGLPFGYPPLAFYLAGILDDITPFSLLTLFRLLPLLATSGTVVAFAFLARDLLKSRVAVVGAVLAFALIPRTYIWLLMGGGLTRSFGLLFALLALHAVYLLYTRGGRRYLFAAILLSAATVLSHVETGWFLAFSVAIFWAAYGRDRRGFASSAILAAGTLVLTAPWWGTVIAQQGLAPFAAAQRAGGSVLTNGATREYVALSLARVVATSEPWYPLLGTLGFVGALVSIATRRYMLVAWWVAVAVLDPRAYPTLVQPAVALLAGVALAEVVVPLLWKTREARGPLSNGHDNGRQALPGQAGSAELLRAARSPQGALAVVLFAFALAGAFVTKGGLAGEGVYLNPLEGGERELMAWINQATPGDASFLVVPRGTWETDREGEWFPVLAGRKSVATVQGFEWAPRDGFSERQDQYWAAFQCGYKTTDCLDAWLSEYPADAFDYVWIPRVGGVQCCGTLVQSLNQDPRYTRIYDSDGGTIWRREQISP